MVCVEYGWETFKKRPKFLSAATVAMIVLTWIVGGIKTTSGDTFIQIFALSMAALVIQTVVDMGLTHFTLKAGDDIGTAAFSDFWHPQPFLNYLVATFLSCLIIIFGLIAFIVPGVILALMFFFVKFLVIDRDLNPIAAMEESARITKGNRLELLLLVITLVALNVAGLLCLVVGLLVSIPVSSIAVAHAYRLLEHGAGKKAPTDVR